MFFQIHVVTVVSGVVERKALDDVTMHVSLTYTRSVSYMQLHRFSGVVPCCTSCASTWAKACTLAATCKS